MDENARTAGTTRRPQQHRCITLRWQLSAIVAVVALLATACGTSGSGSDKAYYAGKNITILVPFAPGGGADATARLFAKLLSKNIPGKPSIVVQNMGGGGGITGVNYFEQRAKRDGTTVLLSSGGVHSAYAVQDPAIKWDFGDFVPYVGVSASAIIFANKNTGITGPENVLDPPGKKLIFGGQAPSGGDLRKLLAMDLVGIPYKPLFGYEGAGEVELSFERGESNVGLVNLLVWSDQYESKVKSGEIVPLMCTCLLDEKGNLVRLKDAPEVPTPEELYEAAHGKAPEGPGWDALKILVSASDSISKALWLHSKDPKAARDAFQKGMDATLADPESRKALDAEFLGSEPLVGAKLTEALKVLSDPDPAAAKWLQDYLVDKWDYKY